MDTIQIPKLIPVLFAIFRVPSAQEEAILNVLAAPLATTLQISEPVSNVMIRAQLAIKQEHRNVLHVTTLENW
jgi:hypothetical protein